MKSMIKTSLGALRYNNKMNKIFDNAKILNEKYNKLRVEFNDLLFSDPDFAKQYNKDDFVKWCDDNNL